MFRQLVWLPDRMVLDDLVFRLEHTRSDEWDGGEHFRFFKIKKLVDQYEAFFSRRPDCRPARLLELGIYDGGSTVFWYELFRPRKHVAVDIRERADSPYFRRYVSSRGLEGRIKTCWGMDQTDKGRLRAVVGTELDGRLDMVIDDASHFYGPTRASFEALFPLCVPGGLYIIEDWAWDHWPEFSNAGHPWADEERLTRLVIELIEAAGTSTQLISNIAVYEGFVVIERGPQSLEDPAAFDLDDHIVRRPIHRVRGRLRRMSKRLKQGLMRRLPRAKWPRRID
jgi:cephalosporin hydroxylase